MDEKKTFNNLWMKNKLLWKFKDKNDILSFFYLSFLLKIIGFFFFFFFFEKNWIDFSSTFMKVHL